LDGSLSAAQRRGVVAHLGECPSCTATLRSLAQTSSLLAGLPRLEQRESIRDAVVHRLEVESRGPGLQMIFRSPWRARPMILPAVGPAAAVLAVLLVGAVVLDRGSEPGPLQPRSAAVWSRSSAAPGTEANPLFQSAGISAPRLTSRSPLLDAPANAGTPSPVQAGAESSVFLETVVARDGRVASVSVLDGDVARGRALAEALLQERFEPARRRGRPVAVSLYRLFSHMEVRASGRDGA